MTSAESTQSALARLSFWVMPKRLAEFEGGFVFKITPPLEYLGRADDAR
jgi:hypothetical protein